MNKPRITIGMATYDDFEGAWATIQSVFLHNEWASPDDVQIVAIDTSPQGSEHRRLVRDLIGKGGNALAGSRTQNIKYIAYDGPPSTTAPRDLVFDHADAPIVCVMDCHVMLPSNRLRRLVDWFESNPDCQDLIHGPIVYDNLHVINTHFSDQFRGGMWGTWGNAWRSPKGQLFTTEPEEVTDEDRQRASDGKVHFHDLMTLKEFPRDDRGWTTLPTGEQFPPIDWPAHEPVLESHGCVEAARDDDAEPFEIPGCGMGLFACRKDAWLGFAKNCSGFGGEELNIHTKYRQAGRKALCLPFLKWNHRFGRAGGAPYPLPLAAKIRNYVLWANELGLPFDRIHTHFVASGQFPAEQWAKLIADPLTYPINLSRPQRTMGIAPLDALYAWAAQNARDLKEHAEPIQAIASRADSVVAFVKRCDWEPILASGFPATLDVYQTEELPLIDQTHEAVAQQHVKDHRQLRTYSTRRPKNGDNLDPLSVEPHDCDLLVIDRDNSAEYLTAVLDRWGNHARKILIRGTQTFGEQAEFGDGPGLWPAMRSWIETHPDWFIAMHRANQYGLTLLSREPEWRPESPIVPWPIGYGPGTELKAMLESVGIVAPPSCDCNAFMKQMDQWGIDGCRENFDAIVERLRKKSDDWGWTKVFADKSKETEENHQLTMAEKIKIGIKTFTTGLAWKVNWLDPYPGLAEESIARAEANQGCAGECKPEGCSKPTCGRKQTA
jgi:hypothetical protein